MATVKLLLDAGADPNGTNHDGWTPLISACGNGYTEVVELLIKAGANVDAKNKDCVTALSSASEEGRTEVVELLIKAGVDVNARTKYNATALVVASANGQVEVAELLIKAGADINAINKKGEYALWSACDKGSKAVVELLIKAGADINDKLKAVGTALMCASGKGHTEVVEFLIKAGADVNAQKSSDGHTALHFASGQGCTEVVELLIKAGADVNTTNTYGYTCLIRASEEGHKEVVELLIKAGVDVNAKTNLDFTALSSASAQGRTEVVELLIKAGADVNTKDYEAVTPLSSASAKGHTEVVDLLVKAGADVNAINKEGLTPLGAALSNGKTAVLEPLLKAGADPNVKNKDGLTALEVTTAKWDKAAVELLLLAGADPNVMNLVGETPRTIATSKGYKDVAELLLKAEEAPLRALLEDIRKCELGPTAPSVGVPAGAQGAAQVALAELPELMLDLHEGMPLALSHAPMRLLMIDAVLAWPTIKVYDDFEDDFEGAAAAECLDVPYCDVSDAQWSQTLVVSWRWGASKPAQAQPGFTPMTEPQFRELKQMLQLAKGSGLQYVWIDWSCVPQYSAPSMVEVLRSKMFYIRARSMAVIPTFQPLPSEGVVRLLLSKVARLLKKRSADSTLSATAAAVLDAILAKDLVAGREYFSRVWTLAERMARHGRREQLNQWMSLEAWLGMVVDAMLRSTEDRSASAVYRKILGQDAGDLLDTIMAPLAEAIGTSSMLVVEGLEDKVADLFCTAVSIWMAGSTLEEAPTKDWLRSYLLEADLGVYQAWSEADRVWAVYSYYCWKQVDQGSAEGLATALRDLAKVAGGSDPAPLFAAMGKKLGLSDLS